MNELRLAIARGQDPALALRQSAPPSASVEELWQMRHEVSRGLRGISPALGRALEIPGLTDLLINGVKDVWVDRGRGLEPGGPLGIDLQLQDATQLRNLAVRMAGAAGRRLDDASPIVDATLPGGIRMHALLPPLCGAEPVVSLRILPTSSLSLAELERRQMVAPEILPLLMALVERRDSVLISGATGSGKTTLLAALLSEIESSQRLICIEEVSELAPNHPHVVHLQERQSNVQAAGAVSLSDLVKAAMRMRPDRLILGEARGPEVREMLLALNTGHRGGWATIHANSGADVPARLIALGALAGMSQESVALQGAAAFDAILQVSRGRDAQGRVRRWVSEICALQYSEGQLSAPWLCRISPPEVPAATGGLGRPGEVEDPGRAAENIGLSADNTGLSVGREGLSGRVRFSAAGRQWAAEILAAAEPALPDNRQVAALSTGRGRHV